MNSPTRRTGHNFYSRPCGRGDATLCAWRMGRILFLLTPLREGRLSIILNDGAQYAFLLTPLREGRPGAHGYRFTRQNISTHAPAGGATLGLVCDLDGEKISTHAPAGGATNGCSIAADGCRDFYSRPCGRGDFLFAADGRRICAAFLLTPLREGRRMLTASLTCIEYISTHAPAGGAT